MKQVARNLTDPVDGFLREAKYLIHDRDPLFTEAFTAILRSRGVETVKIPAKSPNCNPHAERFVRTIKSECLKHFIFFGERHLRYVVKEFVDHYLAERFHQGIGGHLIKVQARPANDNRTKHPIVCRSRLGSLLNYYHREAARASRRVFGHNGAPRLRKPVDKSTIFCMLDYQEQAGDFAARLPATTGRPSTRRLECTRYSRQSIESIAI